MAYKDDEGLKLLTELIVAHSRKEYGKRASKIGAAILVVGAGIFVGSIFGEIYKPSDLVSVLGRCGSVMTGIGTGTLGVGIYRFVSGKKQIEKVKAELIELANRREPFDEK